MRGESRVSDTHCKLLIELVGEEGVGELPEVQLAQGPHAVDVLHVRVLGQVRNILAVKLVPVGRGRELRVRDRVLLNKTLLLTSQICTSEKAQKAKISEERTDFALLASRTH